MPEPAHPFGELKLNKQLLNAITDAGYGDPTPIQLRAIPLILAGHDLLGIAPTGTGKTAAFVLPLIMKIKYAQGHDPRAVILSPTKELAIQTHRNVKNLSKYTDVRSALLYGGIGPKMQIAELREGCDILVATPGRFLELYIDGEIAVKNIKTLILDEADRMMDMGFIPQIRRILEVLRSKKRQNLLFSATMPDKVVKLSEEFLEFPERVEVAPQATTASTIDQVLYRVPNLRTKISVLEHFLENPSYSRVMIFARTKANADNVFKFISRKGLAPTKVVHSNKSQNARINAVNAFESGEIRVLVTTDVASRGLDISDVSHVINFDVPTEYTDYVHRIGRTGRARKEGIAITFCTDAERYHVKQIEKLIRTEIPTKPLPKEVVISETPFEEAQQDAREIDRQKRLADPSFQGAFHVKKGKEKGPGKDKTDSKRRRHGK